MPFGSAAEPYGNERVIETTGSVCRSNSQTVIPFAVLKTSGAVGVNRLGASSAGFGPSGSAGAAVGGGGGWLGAAGGAPCLAGGEGERDREPGDAGARAHHLPPFASGALGATLGTTRRITRAFGSRTCLAIDWTEAGVAAR